LLAALCTIGCLLAGLRFALGAGLRATAARGPAREIALLETLRLPDAAALHLIRAGDRLVVVGRAGSQLTAICEWPDSGRRKEPAAPGLAAPAASGAAAAGPAGEGPEGDGSPRAREPA
jgi:hypothetical protein